MMLLIEFLDLYWPVIAYIAVVVTGMLCFEHKKNN